jgi:hypothetical protein
MSQSAKEQSPFLYASSGLTTAIPNTISPRLYLSPKESNQMQKASTVSSPGSSSQLEEPVNPLEAALHRANHEHRKTELEKTQSKLLRPWLWFQEKIGISVLFALCVWLLLLYFNPVFVQQSKTSLDIEAQNTKGFYQHCPPSLWRVGMLSTVSGICLYLLLLANEKKEISLEDQRTIHMLPTLGKTTNN